MMLKHAIKSALARAGYRLVRTELDAQSAMKALKQHNFRTIIDVGAATGATVVRWLDEFPHAHVHAIEPLPQPFAKLAALASRHRTRVTLHNCAVGAEDGEATMLLHVDHPTSSSLLNRTRYSAEIMPDTARQTPVTVIQKRLDSLISNHATRLASPVLLKLDVQGYEGAVIEGATELLRQVDFVLSEISLAPVYERQTAFDALHQHLSRHGFVFYGFLEQFHLGDGLPIYADVIYRRALIA